MLTSLLALGCDQAETPAPELHPPVTSSLPMPLSASQPAAPSPGEGPGVAVVPVPSAPAPAALPTSAIVPLVTATDGVQYADDFLDVSGHLVRIDDGNWVQDAPKATRRIYPFMDSKRIGKLVLDILEDRKTLGPDGKPGVLSVTWAELPQAIAYCGFTYLGRTPGDRRLVLPALHRARTPDDLRRLRLRFQYRAVNSLTPTPKMNAIGCRLELRQPESYRTRLDFGELRLKETWSVFEADFSKGTNVKAFLEALAAAPDSEFKIVFSQVGGIQAIAAGDTIQIDDIEVSFDPSAGSDAR